MQLTVGRRTFAIRRSRSSLPAAELELDRIRDDDDGRVYVNTKTTGTGRELRLVHAAD